MAHDPKQTIIDFLSTPLAESNSPLIVESDSRPLKAVLRTSGGLGAITSTIQFLKERTLPRHQAYIVSFEDGKGQKWEFICFIVQEEQNNWVFKGGSGGSPDQTVERKQPWANLSGGWTEGGFYAGGRVHDNEFGTVRVSLFSNDGLILEDTVDDGRVLFLTDKENVLAPVQARLYASPGRLVSSHTVFNI